MKHCNLGNYMYFKLILVIVVYNTSLKTVIPSGIAEILEVSANDTIKWTIKEDNTIIVEKLIL